MSRFRSTKALIHRAEGTTDEQARANGVASGYDVTFDYGKIDREAGLRNKPISEMTVGEVKAYQSRAKSVYASRGVEAVPVGKYQVIGSTMNESTAALGISDDAKFTPAVQEQIGEYLLDKRGGRQFEAGQLSVMQYQQNLSQEWASLPAADTGRSFYGGDALVSAFDTEDALLGDANSFGVKPPALTTTDALRTGRTQGANVLAGGDALAASRGVNSDDSGRDPILITGGRVGCPESEVNVAGNESVLDGIWTPTPNPFLKFSSMTYSVSFYLLNPAKYNKMLAEGNRSVQGMTLLFQSGGITNNSGQNSAFNFGAIRSPAFPVDFYIDDIQLESLVSGTSTSAAHNTFKANFTVSEPAGLTFIDRLKQAVEEFNVREQIHDGKINYIAQQYLMVIRFYGYDAGGNLMTASALGTEETFTDPRSTAEKFIPIQITGITFRIAAETVVYNVSAICPSSYGPLNTTTGAVPLQTRVAGSTLKEILGGALPRINQAQADQDAADGLDEDSQLPGDANPVSYVDGLMYRLNFYQERLDQKNIIQHRNIYEVIFEDEEIANATIAAPGSPQLKSTRHNPGVIAGNSLNANLEKSSGPSLNHSYRDFQIPAGLKIKSVIDYMVRISSYITDQLSETRDANKSEDDENAVILGKPTKDMKWFVIEPEIRVLDDQYDEIRNDYAYHIIYHVRRREVIPPNSPYITPEHRQKCFGIHKQYNYWFTGENTEIESFEQDFNYLWFMSFGPAVTQKQLENTAKFNAGSARQMNFQVNSNEVEMGDEEKETEGAANMAADLYSPGDQGMITMDIVGDPDYIAQSEIFYSPTYKIANDLVNSPRMPDGSVNPGASEILFMLNFNTVVDYELTGPKAGLADVVHANYGKDEEAGIAGLARQSFIYRANTITSKLVGGKFSQTIGATLMPIKDECICTLQKVVESLVADSVVKTSDIKQQTGSSLAPSKPTPELTPSALTAPVTVPITGETVINNGISSDTPKPGTPNDAKGLAAAAQAQADEDAANMVDEESLGLNGDDVPTRIGGEPSITRSINRGLNRAGRFIGDVWASRTGDGTDVLDEDRG